MRNLQRVSRAVGWGCIHLKAGLGLEKLLPQWFIHVAGSGAAGGGRPQFVLRGPPNRTACASSQYGGCFPQSQQRGGHSVLHAPSSKVTHSQCLQFPTGYIGLPCSLWERTSQDMNSGRKVSPGAILGAHGLEVNQLYWGKFRKFCVCIQTSKGENRIKSMDTGAGEPNSMEFDDAESLESSYP